MLKYLKNNAKMLIKRTYQVFVASVIFDWSFMMIDWYILPDYCGGMLFVPLLILARLLEIACLSIFVLYFSYIFIREIYRMIRLK